MTSGTCNNEFRECGLCGKKLRPLRANNDWNGRKYHVSCFTELISDIANYSKVAYTKYNVVRDYKLINELEQNKEIKLNFD